MWLGALALRVLLRLASALEAWLLALFHPRITREHAGSLQWRSKLLVGNCQRTRNALPDRAGLTAHAATFDIDDDVVLVESVGESQRLGNGRLVLNSPTEIFRCRLSVDGDLAATWIETDACYSRLSSPIRVEISCSLAQCTIPIPQMLLKRFRELPAAVRGADAPVQYRREAS